MKVETGEAKPYDRVRIPDEIYRAEFIGTKDVKDGKFGKRVAFLFNVDVDGRQVELAKICYNKKANPKNDIGNVLLALGAKLDGSELDTDALKGVKCRAVVEDYTYKDTEGNDKLASIISKVKPLAEKAI